MGIIVGSSLIARAIQFRCPCSIKPDNILRAPLTPFLGPIIVLLLLLLVAPVLTHILISTAKCLARVTRLSVSSTRGGDGVGSPRCKLSNRRIVPFGRQKVSTPAVKCASQRSYTRWAAIFAFRGNVVSRRNTLSWQNACLALISTSSSYEETDLSL